MRHILKFFQDFISVKPKAAILQPAKEVIGATGDTFKIMNTAFDTATNGKWQSSLYIECVTCPHKGNLCAGDFLLAADREGKPVFETIAGRKIEKSECLSVLSDAVFNELYATWFGKNSME